MTRKFMPVQKAKEEIERLQKYVALAENYDDDTLEKCIIKEYAYTNSMTKVVQNVNAKGFYKGGSIDRNDVIAVIDGKIMDELHKIVRQGYRGKLKARNKI